MEEIEPLQRRLHVIADDDDEGKELLCQELHNQRGMYCCCFSSVPMAACCMAAFLDPSQSHSDEPNNGGDSSDAHTEITVFNEAARIARTVGAAVIKREAAAINRRLLQIQNQGLQQPEEAADEEPSKKRRKLNISDNREESPSADRTKSATHGDNARAAAAAAVSHQDQESIWNQVDRMKRMSMFLKNAQLAHNLLLQEMKESLEDSKYLVANGGVDR